MKSYAPTIALLVLSAFQFCLAEKQDIFEPANITAEQAAQLRDWRENGEHASQLPERPKNTAKNATQNTTHTEMEPATQRPETHKNTQVEKKPHDACNASKRRKRGEDLFAKFPQPAGRDCKNQLADASIEFNPTGPGTFSVRGIPPACMPLSGLFIDDPSQPKPIPLGPDTLEFTEISDEDLKELQAILDCRGD
ncbi:hypothetical protein BDV25DRAFT_138521 [Aspergillus avenaceus]|uniref:Uncharacterized protein n=1 Tax=Aspergillus avenaceus TaxID=36643 RepID=A0A5N6TZN4_ASPAV|nr:hypothetical protein BDV25DRAFT_138521 [Aspergillus avenaceus]